MIKPRVIIVPVSFIFRIRCKPSSVKLWVRREVPVETVKWYWLFGPNANHGGRHILLRWTAVVLQDIRSQLIRLKSHYACIPREQLACRFIIGKLNNDWSGNGKKFLLNSGSIKLLTLLFCFHQLKSSRQVFQAAERCQPLRCIIGFRVIKPLFSSYQRHFVRRMDYA
jgi:hypothetical protein